MRIEKTKGRKLTTGCYTTREGLVEKVHWLYRHTTSSMVQIARHCEVSTGTVQKIIDREQPESEPRT